MTIQLAAAPMGARVGLATARRGDHQVLVTVAPKAWRESSLRHFAIDGAEWPGHARISLFETERLRITGETDEVGSLLWDVLGASRREVSGSPSWDSSMLVPDAQARGQFSYAPFPDRHLESETADILRLFDRIDLLHAHTEDLLAGWTSSPLHQPLLHRRFLDEVAKQLTTVRPGYRQVLEARATIRGRVSPRSLALWSRGASTTVVCTYGELTLSTQLLSCVAAALEWIADGRGARSRLPGEFSDLRLRHDAVTLRRALADVTALPPTEAVAIARTLRLSRLDQAWASALTWAIATLAQREAVAVDARQTRSQAVELSVPTDKLWERIVHEALMRCGFHDVVQQANSLTTDPWVRHPIKVSQTFPDNVALTDSEVFIVDAKYKTPGAGDSPSRDDQYQMFAYSHLVRDDPRIVRAAVLVYPGEASRARWLRGRDASPEPVKLVAVQIPFPTRSQNCGPGSVGSLSDRSRRAFTPRPRAGRPSHVVRDSLS